MALDAAAESAEKLRAILKRDAQVFLTSKAPLDMIPDFLDIYCRDMTNRLKKRKDISQSKREILVAAYRSELEREVRHLCGN